MNEPACACQRVKYDPIDNGDGTLSERWRCTDCGGEFVKALKLDTMTKYSEQQSATIARGDAQIEALESGLDAAEKARASSSAVSARTRLATSG